MIKFLLISLEELPMYRLAQDITSETFFKAIKGLDRFKWQNVPISAWLYKIALIEINERISERCQRQNERRDYLQQRRRKQKMREMINLKKSSENQKELLKIATTIELLA